MNAANQLRLIGVLAAKDWRIESRRPQAFLNTLFFAVLILIIFNFAFDPGSPATREAAPGILWVALLFPGVIQLNRSFQSETEEGTLQGIVLSPMDRGAVFLGKFLANWIFLVVIDLLILVAFVLFYNFSFTLSLLWIVLTLVLAVAGFTAIGTLLAAMLATIRRQDVLLPILLFPLLIPIILAAVSASQEILIRQEEEFLAQWLQFLVGFDVVFLAAGFMVFDYVVGD